MSSPYETPLRLKLSLSVAYKCWLITGYTSAMLVMLFLTSLAVSLKLLLLLMLGVALYGQWRQLCSLPSSLIQQTDADWVLTGQTGRKVSARLLDKAYVTRWLIILYFRMPNDKPRSVMVFAPMLDKNSFRRLSVYLRMTNLRQFMTDE